MKVVLLSLLLLACSATSESLAQKQTIMPYSASLFVADIDKALQWYTTVLPLKLRNRTDNEERGFKQVNVENEEMIVELVEVSSSISSSRALEGLPNGSRILGYYKVGFRVDDLDSWHKELEGKNVEFYGRIVTDQLSGKRSFLIKDPDGNILQFFER